MLCGDEVHVHVCTALAPPTHDHRIVFYCDACHVHFGITHATVEHRRVVLLYAPLDCPGFSSESALLDTEARYADFSWTLPCCDCCPGAACRRPGAPPQTPQPSGV